MEHTITNNDIDMRSELFVVTYEVVQGEGSIIAQADGVLIPSGTLVPLGTQIEFTATTDIGMFDHWEVNGVVETSQTFTLIIEEDTHVQLWEPWFSIFYEVVQGEGGVFAEANGMQIASGAGVLWGVIAEFTATPAPGYIFERWASNVEVDETNPTVSLVVETDILMRAYFVAESAVMFDVFYNVAQGEGTITAEDIDGMQFSDSISVPAGTTIEFNATPGEGYVFDLWTVNGAVIGRDPRLLLAIEENSHVQAWFIVEPMAIIMYEVAQGEGVIVAEVNGVQIQSGALLPIGTLIEFTAIPSPGYVFDRWTDIGIETAQTFLFEIQMDILIQAFFVAELVVVFDVFYDVAQGEGTILAEGVDGMPVPSGITVPAGTTIEFNATPGEGYFFDRWTVNGNIIEAGPMLLLVAEENLHVQAWFDALPTEEVRVEFAFHKADQRIYNERRREQTAQYLLAGATFKLYQYNGENPPDRLVQPGNVGDGPEEWQVVGIQTSTGRTDEPIVFELISGQTYQMAEIAAPIGFVLPHGQWRIVADREGNFNITSVAGIAVSSFIEINGNRYVGNVEMRATTPCNTTNNANKSPFTTTDILILSAIATTCSMKKPRQK